MIALMILAGIAIWLVVVIALTVWIPRVLGDGWPRTIARLILFPVLLILPIVDEWIGRRQFEQLCQREAVVHLSPDWRSIKRAKGPIEEEIYLKTYAIQIREIRQKYIDVDNGRKFMEIKWFFREWGLLGRIVGAGGLGHFSSMSCSPPDRSQILEMINIDKLFIEEK